MNHKLFIPNHVILTLKTYVDINSLRLFYTKLNNKHLKGQTRENIFFTNSKSQLKTCFFR